jgi:hypothetical protein
MIAVRGVFLKGVGWSVLWPQGVMLTVVAALLLYVSIHGFRKEL